MRPLAWQFAEKMNDLEGADERNFAGRVRSSCIIALRFAPV
jgi:hypothetical protein